jgi:hypothetical protein
VKIMTDYDDERRRTALTTRANHDLSPGSDFAWVDPSWSSRRRGRAIGKTLQEYTGGLEIAKRFLDVGTGYQQSMRAFELAREQRSLTPLMIEQQRQALGHELQRGQQAANLSAQEYEIDMLLRQEQKIQILKRIGRLRAEGNAPRSAGPMDDTPPDLRGHLATEHTVARNRDWIRGKIDEIRGRAAAQGRPLNIEEIEQIDRYQDAEVSSEASIRRRGASDL